MRWIRELTATTREPTSLIGAKAQGLVELHRLDLPVPAGFVITTEACRTYLHNERLPDGLRDELRAATKTLEAVTGRRFGGRPPLSVSVRSGAGVSMPGMMDTIVNLGLTCDATAALTAETGDARFAVQSRERFLSSFAAALTGAGTAAASRTASDHIPAGAAEQLELAVETVFASWRTPRARTYRELHDIDHDLGTAVVVQVMVFGNRNARSGSGVAFSRNPNTGEPSPYGDVLFAHQGEDVVAGTSLALPLGDLATGEPHVWAALTNALARAEAHYRDAVYVEFTFEAGTLWLLQVRSGRFTGAAAIRTAVDLADEGQITRSDAVLRVSARQLRDAHVPCIATNADTAVLGRGVGACPGVASGAIATTTHTARRMATEGPVILVRPETSPNDMNGLAVAAGILTARGGPASHAAVVARSLGRPAVVGMRALTMDDTNATVAVGGRTLAEGTLVTIDGTSGEVALGTVAVTTIASGDHLERLLVWADELAGENSERDEVERLAAAQATLRPERPYRP